MIGSLDDVIQFYDSWSKDSIFIYTVDVLKELMVYHYLDASTLNDLCQMIG